MKTTSKKGAPDRELASAFGSYDADLMAVEPSRRTRGPPLQEPSRSPFRSSRSGSPLWSPACPSALRAERMRGAGRCLGGPTRSLIGLIKNFPDLASERVA